jgi:hypothetical protein
MKCVEWGIATGFEWPDGGDSQTRVLWEAAYEGPLCKVCSGDSPMRGLWDSQEPAEGFCYALRRRQKTDGLLVFTSLIELYSAGGCDSQNLDDVEDL